MRKITWSVIGLCWMWVGCAEKKEVVKVAPQVTTRAVQPEEIYNQAVAALQAGKLEEATAKLQQAIGKWNKEPRRLADAYYNLGVIAMKRRDWDTARRHLAKVVELQPTHRDALLNLGVVLKEKHDYQAAIKHYQQALKKVPRDALVMNNLIMLYRLSKQYKQAEKTGHLLLARAPNNVEAYKNMTLIYYDQGKYKMAELLCINAGKMLEKKRQQDPKVKDDPGIYANLGMIYLKLGKTKKALAQFHKALEVDPSHRDALLNIGAIAHRFRDYATCQKVYQKVLDRHPDDITALRGLAYAVYGSGKAKEAIALFEKVVKKAPEDKRAVYILGDIYYTFLHDYQKAIQYFNRYRAAMGRALAKDDPVHNRLQAAQAKLQMATQLKKEEEEARRREEQKRRKALKKSQAESPAQKKEGQEKLREMLKGQEGKEGQEEQEKTGQSGSSDEQGAPADDKQKSGQADSQKEPQPVSSKKEKKGEEAGSRKPATPDQAGSKDDKAQPVKKPPASEPTTDKPKDDKKEKGK